MPKAEFCPVCKERMQRLYEREREGYGGARSKFWGYLWICPERHTVIIDPKGSVIRVVYKLEALVGASG